MNGWCDNWTRRKRLKARATTEPRASDENLQTFVHGMVAYAGNRLKNSYRERIAQTLSVLRTGCR